MKYIVLFMLSGALLASSLPRKTDYDYEPVLDEVSKDLQSDRIKLRTRFAISVIVKTSARLLRKHGYPNDALQIEDEWTQNDVRFFSDNLSVYDIGDYKPLSEWLAKWYDKLEAAIPPKIFALTRLKDIKILNYGIPVAFDPKNGQWDKVEYGKHFVPLSGVATYWSVQAGCSAGTAGVGIIVICGVAARGAERVMVKRIAPKISNRIYDRANPL